MSMGRELRMKALEEKYLPAEEMKKKYEGATGL